MKNLGFRKLVLNGTTPGAITFIVSAPGVVPFNFH